MGFGITLQRKSLYCQMLKGKFPASLKNHLARNSFVLISPPKHSNYYTESCFKCHQDTLTVMMNGTVLIISRMKEMRKICSQMFP